MARERVISPADAASLSLAVDKASPASDATAEAGDTRDWERLWLAIQRTSWMSIALVPIGEGIETKRLAEALAEVGRQHLGARVVVHDATGVSISSLQSAVAEIIDCEDRAIIALPPLTECPAGVELARAADAVVLCIALGESTIAEAERVEFDVGEGRVLGAVIVRKGGASHESHK